MNTYNSEKAIAAILYLAAALPEQGNLYKVLKAIYRANKEHLHRYGRQIFEERYQALKFGTVPAYAYDIVKHVRDDKWQPRMPKAVKKRLSVSKDDTIVALVAPNMEMLSESDVECLDEAIAFFKDMDFNRVKNNAHEDEAYNAAPRNSYIPLDNIVRTLPDGEVLLEYLKGA